MYLWPLHQSSGRLDSNPNISENASPRKVTPVYHTQTYMHACMAGIYTQGRNLERPVVTVILIFQVILA